MMIWGGMNTNNTNPVDKIFVLNLDTISGYSVSYNSSAIEMRKNPQGFAMGNQFCFLDTWVKDVPKERQLWCFDEGISLFKCSYFFKDVLRNK